MHRPLRRSSFAFPCLLLVVAVVTSCGDADGSDSGPDVGFDRDAADADGSDVPDTGTDCSVEPDLPDILSVDTADVTIAVT